MWGLDTRQHTTAEELKNTAATTRQHRHHDSSTTASRTQRRTSDLDRPLGSGNGVRDTPPRLRQRCDVGKVRCVRQRVLQHHDTWRRSVKTAMLARTQQRRQAPTTSVALPESPSRYTNTVGYRWSMQLHANDGCWVTAPHHRRHSSQDHGYAWVRTRDSGMVVSASTHRETIGGEHAHGVA